MTTFYLNNLKLFEEYLKIYRSMNSRMRVCIIYHTYLFTVTEFGLIWHAKTGFMRTDKGMSGVFSLKFRFDRIKPVQKNYETSVQHLMLVASA